MAGSGAWVEYIRYEKQKAKYVYTWEVFGDLKAHNDDCFRMFNPVRGALSNISARLLAASEIGLLLWGMHIHSVAQVTKSDYEDNVNRWAAAALALAAEVVQRELGADVFADESLLRLAPSPPLSPEPDIRAKQALANSGAPALNVGAVQRASPHPVMASPDLPPQTAANSAVVEAASHWMTRVGAIGRVASVAAVLLAGYVLLRAGWMLTRAFMSG